MSQDKKEEALKNGKRKTIHQRQGKECHLLIRNNSSSETYQNDERKKKCPPRILYPAKLSFKSEDTNQDIHTQK